MSGAVGFGGSHDVGGTFDPSPVEQETHPYEHWELQVAGLVSVLAMGGYTTINEFRRAVEELPPAVGAAASYYEKWALAAMNVLLDRRVITAVELDVALGRSTGEGGTIAKFLVGDAVLVKAEDAAHRYRKV